MRGREVMSQGEDRDRRKYGIDIGAYGSIGVSAN
jgi:hypothetical protein